MYMPLELRASTLSPSIKTFPSYTRLKFPVNERSIFNVLKDGKGDEISLKISNFNPDAWTNNIPTFSDKRVSVKGVMEKGKIHLSFNLLLKNSKHFTYFYKDPPVIIVDIWNENIKNKKRKKKRIVRTKRKKKIDNPSANLLINKEDRILSLNKDLLLDHDFIVPKFSYIDRNIDTTRRIDIGANWKWTKVDVSKKGSVHFSLAKKLFRRKSYALAIKSTDIFERDCPESIYKNEIHFLKALAYLKLGELKKNPNIIRDGNRRLKVLMLKEFSGKDSSKYKKFINDLRFYYGLNSYLIGNWVEAVSNFEFIRKLYSNKNEKIPPVLLMLMAESYFQMKNFQRSKRIYNNVITLYKNTYFEKESLYRLANTLAVEGNYKRSIVTFLRALHKYPEYDRKRTEANFNLAEVYYRTRDFKNSRKFYKSFIQKNPSHTIAGIAYIRLGEIAELLNKDIRSAEKYYRKTRSRFPFSFGSKLALIHLSRLKHKDSVNFDYRLKAIRKIYDSKSTPGDLRMVAQIELVHYLIYKSEINEAINLVELGLRNNGGKWYEKFKSIYSWALSKKLDLLINQGNYTSALQLYNSKKQWIDGIGPGKYKLLASLYEGLNLFTTSNEYRKKYLQIVLSKYGKNISAASSENKRINFIKAQRLFAQNKFKKAIRLLKGSSYFKSLHIRALSYKKLNNRFKAKSEAKKGIKLYVDNKKQISAKDFRNGIIDFTEILYNDAEENLNYKKMHDLLEKANNELPVKYERFSFLKADTFWYQENHAEAIKSYQEAIKKYPKSERLNRTNYRLAISYISIGNEEMATKILKKLKDSSNDVWSESAEQELALMGWEKKYSSILRAAPPVGIGINF